MNNFKPKTRTTGRIRFSKSPWFDKLYNQKATVIGAGGIGSWLVHFLAKIGMYVDVWDGDSYNVNNIGGQLMSGQAINNNKAQAIAHLVNQLVGSDTQGGDLVHPVPTMFDASSHQATRITLVTADSMEVRKMVYEAWKKLDNRLIFIDGRMGAEQFDVYTATRDHDTYMDYWYPSSEAVDLPCAYRATSHIGSMAASAMVGMLTNYMADDDLPERFGISIPGININHQFPTHEYVS